MASRCCCGVFEDVAPLGVVPLPPNQGRKPTAVLTNSCVGPRSLPHAHSARTSPEATEGRAARKVRSASSSAAKAEAMEGAGM